ncbi:glucosamine-6-phosphate deaminase [Paenibacillus beijingensis]|uniref:Glucosamine-6-phosphate deaminase n=1 Tax=Paenibacillus beijingensis TaxID=1126833 RepID=A0A0D5NLH3_9BACL|nr:glucosamine-6-phosphate deaminase [Paenibacillus beijingensis]AJY76005.1 glucosamine-6-phosphate deaminase [Paenibacillus beijingensis]
MEIHIFDDNAQLDTFAAQYFIDTVTRKPDAVLGLATGSTPIGIYGKLIKLSKEQNVSFRDVTTFNLDEYVGLTKDDEQSYAYYMNHHLFSHIDIPQQMTHLPNGRSADLEADCKAYDRMLEEQRIDVQLLGLGHNGHIGFNEPAPELSGGTHVVNLEEATREANARFFSSLDEVPKQAVTMGVGSILKARAIMLVVRGADKAAIVKRALTGPITTECPASLLQTHPRVIVLLDREAGRMMN